MSYLATLRREINAELDRLEASGKPWIAERITQDIIDKHKVAFPVNDNEFWFYSAYRYIRSLITKVINNRAGGVDIVGFHTAALQSYYVVTRDGEDQGVPVTALSDRELEAKARAMEAMGETCKLHAKEIRLFIQWRKIQDTAAAATA